MSAAGPLVTVIIATYNRADLVIQAVESARAQSYRPVEIIVVDDASTDDTVGRLAAMDDIRVVAATTRRGPGAARNAALPFARGTFIAPLDSDDLWDPDFLERSVVALVDLDLDFVFSNWRHASGEPSGLDTTLARKPYIMSSATHDEWSPIAPPALRRLFLAGNQAPSSSMVVRRTSMPGGWSEEMLLSDDHHLVLGMVLGGAVRAAFTPARRWSKRVDGQNLYEALALSDLLRRTLSDREQLLRDFSGQLSLRERAYWRAWLWRLRYRAIRRLGAGNCRWLLPTRSGGQGRRPVIWRRAGR